MTTARKAKTPATTPAGRRERERARHRGEILAAALDLFSRQGFAETSMAQIAARAEFAVGTLYRFFSDKEALYQALILDSARQFEQALSAALDAPGDEVAKLECYLETKARLLVQYLPAARLYFAHAALAAYVPAAGLDQEVLGIFLSVRSRLEMVMTAAVRKKLLADVDPRLLMHAFEAISNGFLPALIEHPEDLSADQMAQVAKQVFFEPIRRNSRSK